MSGEKKLIDANLSDKTRMTNAALVDFVYYMLEDIDTDKGVKQEVYECLCELRTRFLTERLKAVVK